MVGFLFLIFIMAIVTHAQLVPPSSCLGPDLLVGLKQKLTFNEAQQACSALGGSLTRITSKVELEAISTFLTNNVLASPWVGINSVIGDGDPTNFVFTDGTTDGLDFIQVEKFTFPWNAGNPDNLLNDENCVQ